MKVALTAMITAAIAVQCLAQPNHHDGDATDSVVVAVVLGKEITAAEKDKLNGIIFGTLLQQFAAEENIEPSEEELDAFVIRSEEMEKQSQTEWEEDRERLIEQLKNSTLSDQARESKASRLKTIESILKSTREIEERTKGMEAQMHAVKRRMAHQFVSSWKVNKALYEKYGGRVIFQQAGPEPVDAYRDFLKQQENNGAFQIIDKQYEAAFWNYFTNDSMHIFYDKEDGAKFMNTPWWMMDDLPGK